MTKARIAHLRMYWKGAAAINECLDEIERLQAQVKDAAKVIVKLSKRK